MGSEVAPPSPSQAGETPTGLESGLRFAYSGQPHQLELPGQGLTFTPSGPLSPGGPMSPGNP